MNQVKRKSPFDADKTQVGGHPPSIESDLAAMRRQLESEQEDEGESDGKTVVMGVGGRTSQLDDAFSEKTIIGRPEDLRGMEMPPRKPIQTKTQAVATPPPTMSTPPPTMSRQMAPPVAMEEEEEPVPPPPPKIHRARKLDEDNTDAELQISQRSRGGILRLALIGGLALAAIIATVLLSTHYRPNHIATGDDGEEQTTTKAGRKGQKQQAEAERPPAMPEPVRQAAVAQPVAQAAAGDDSMQKLSEQFAGDFATAQRQVQGQGGDR